MKYLTIMAISMITLVSCSSGWGDEEKGAYLEACTIDSDMVDYCECTLDKVMKASPDPADAAEVDIMAIAEECIDLMPGLEDYQDLLDDQDVMDDQEVMGEYAPWSDEEKSSYMDACAMDSDMEAYCECTLKKVMEASPNAADAMSVDIMAISMECIDLMPGMDEY